MYRTRFDREGLFVCLLWKRSNEIEFLSLLTGINGSPLVVVDQMLQRLKPTLADAVKTALDVDTEVLVATGGLQRHGVIANLEDNTIEPAENALLGSY